MLKITKRLVDSLPKISSGESFVWDQELRGFGLRMKSTGSKTYLVQYRNADGLTRRLVLGKHGALTPEQARRLAMQKLAAVASGEDPSADRHALRAGLTVAEVCDWYLTEAGAGRLLGRNRRIIKESTLASDRSRVNLHIKPLIGARAVRTLTLADIERMQADIARGKTTKPRKGSRGGAMKGGAGVAGRTVATLRAILGQAKRWRVFSDNPAIGVRQAASGKRTRRLSELEIHMLGEAMRICETNAENPTALAALRLMLMTGFRRSEALGLRFDWLDPHAIKFPDTKCGPQTRAVGAAVLELIAAQRVGDDQIYVFPSDRTDGHLVEVVKTLRRACSLARLDGVTPHTLRHTFASVAADQGFTELTIAGLLGHATMGVTQRYIHLDKALVLAADEVSAHVARLLSPVALADRLAA